MQERLLIFYLLMFFSFIGKAQNNNPPADNRAKFQADSFNNEAIKVSRFNCDKDSLEAAIKLFEKAIKSDSSIAIFYSNEAQTFCDLGQYQEAINVLNRYLYNFPINISIEIFRGFLFEKTENIDSAIFCYSEAIKKLNIEIHDDSNNVSILVNRAFVLLFSKGKKDGKSEFDRIKKKFPKDKTVTFMKEIFDSFDRKSYLNQIFSSCLFSDSNERSRSSTIYLSPGR